MILLGGTFVVKINPSIAAKLLYFYLTKEITRDNCEFNFYYNNTSFRPGVLSVGSVIILANWLDKKSIECTSNNDIPVKIQNNSYVLVKSILCTCNIEAGESFLFNSLAACSDEHTSLQIYFKVNLASVYHGHI